MQRKMISLLGAAGLMAMTTVAAVSQNRISRNDMPPPPRAGLGRGVHGQVTAVDAKAGTISVASRWDETLTVKVGPSAKILARKETTVGGLKVGDTIQVNGVFSQLTAASIQSGDLPEMLPPPMGGGRPGRGGRNHHRGPGGPESMGAPEMMGEMGGPGGFGPPDAMGGPGSFSGPDGMDGPGGPDGPGRPGEDGPPMDGPRRTDAHDQDAPRIRGRRVATGARTVAANGPGRPGDLDRDAGPGDPEEFDGPGAPPPPRDGDGLDEGPFGGPGGEGPMGDRPHGERGMRGGPHGERPMDGPRGGMMDGPHGGRMMGGAHLSGKITSLSPLTIAIGDSLSLVIKTDGKTHVTKIVSETLGDIQKGDRIFAAGSFHDNMLNAKSVSVNLEP